MSNLKVQKQQSILFKRNQLINYNTTVDDNYPFYQVELLNKFGVVVDKPWLLTADIVKLFAEQFHETIPASFYKNPQDTKYFTCDELLIEQLVSYIRVAVEGTDSFDPETFKRVEIFNKVLPTYEEGKDFVYRTYTFLDTKEAVIAALGEISKNLASYTRPWSIDELADYITIYNNFTDICEVNLSCKDNAIYLINEYYGNRDLEKALIFAPLLDKKDVVKLSVNFIGNTSKISYTADQSALLAQLARKAKNCPMSKKQAKYFNAMVKNVGLKVMATASNNSNPMRIAKKFIDAEKVVLAAETLAKSGSILERNLVYLLSRAKDESEVEAILDLIKAKNPIVLNQLLLGLLNDDYSSPRTFKFMGKKRYLTSYTENSYDFQWRKSKLTTETKEIITKILQEKLCAYFTNLPKIPGKVYLSEELKNIPLPTSTASTGSGLGILPTGSRVPLSVDSKIRIFTHWKDVYDIDLSLIFVRNNGKRDYINFSNYSTACSDACRFSGDCRAATGSEFFDVDLSKFREYCTAESGIKYILASINGFGGPLKSDNVFVGYQDVTDFDTSVWNSKNIALQLQAKGDTRAYLAFAVDVETNELVILNQMIDSADAVVNSAVFNMVKPALNKDNLKAMNMFNILACRAEQLVSTPEEADVVFDSNWYDNDRPEQKIIRLSDISALISYISE